MAARFPATCSGLLAGYCLVLLLAYGGVSHQVGKVSEFERERRVRLAGVTFIEKANQIDPADRDARAEFERLSIDTRLAWVTTQPLVAVILSDLISLSTYGHYHGEEIASLSPPILTYWMGTFVGLLLLAGAEAFFVRAREADAGVAETR